MIVLLTFYNVIKLFESGKKILTFTQIGDTEQKGKYQLSFSFFTQNFSFFFSQNGRTIFLQKSIDKSNFSSSFVFFLYKFVLKIEILCKKKKKIMDLCKEFDDCEDNTQEGTEHSSIQGNVTGVIASVGVAGENARTILHSITLVLHIIAVIAQILGRTESLRANATFCIQYTHEQKTIFN